MSNLLKSNHCCAICVAHNPDVELLKKGLLSTLNQLKIVYIVDNGSNSPVVDTLSGFGVNRLEIISLSCNAGIATAFNIGIKRARAAGFEFALLLDQDSIPPGGMVERYLEVFKVLNGNDQKIAALGPRYRHQYVGVTSRFVKFDWFRNTYHGLSTGSSIVPADFLISSGSFYDLNVFDDVGLFDDGLFIDHVDTEWCHRAKNHGYQCFGVWDLIMQHSLGEGSLRFWFLRWRIQPIHKPFRLYFIMRNSLLLYTMSHVPRKWISGDVLRLLRLSLIHLIFMNQRRESLGWLINGFIDGLRGVTGGERVFGCKDATNS